MYAQRKAGRRQRASPAVCTLPMVPCGSSPVTRVSRSPLPCEKRSAWGGGWGDILKPHAQTAHEKGRESDVWLCCSPRGSFRSPLPKCGLARRRPFAKAENTTVFWAVPHVNVTMAFCCVRCVNCRCGECNFKRSWWIARSNRAKRKGCCLLEFKENYGIFRIGQFRSSFDR